MPAPQSFVATSGTHFTLNGKPFYFSGANNYYLGHRSKAMLDAVLDRAQAMQLDVIRTWAFLDRGSLDGSVASVDPPGSKAGVYYQYWDPVARAPAYTDGPDGLERLDAVVHAASVRGLRLILPLINNWKDFGGMDQYVTWFGLKHHGDFFTHPDTRQAYKNWASHLLNRKNIHTGTLYKDEPAIMAWELTNEIRGKGSIENLNTSRMEIAPLTGWIAEMSSFIKQTDPNHLVAIGDEGLLNRSRGNDWIYNGSMGADFDAWLGISGIDFGTFHSYPENWGKNAAWGSQWIEEHLVSARSAGKPVLLEEYGWKNHATRDSAFRSWLDTVLARDGAGDLVWMLAGPQDDGTLYPDYDQYTIYTGADAPSIAVHSNRMHARNG